MAVFHGLPPLADCEPVGACRSPSGPRGTARASGESGSPSVSKAPTGGLWGELANERRESGGKAREARVGSRTSPTRVCRTGNRSVILRKRPLPFDANGIFGAG